jgi:hypothetical protein
MVGQPGFSEAEWESVVSGLADTAAPQNEQSYGQPRAPTMLASSRPSPARYGSSARNARSTNGKASTSGARWCPAPMLPPVTGVLRMGSSHMTPGSSVRYRRSFSSSTTRVSPSPSTRASQRANRGSVNVSVGMALAWWPPTMTLMDGSSPAAIRALIS